MADERTLGVDDLIGRFRGKGTWRDSAGNTGDYDAILTIREIAGGVEVTQKHVFDGGDSEDTFSLESVAPYIFRVEARGEDGGFGYMMNDILRFFINNRLGSITEIGYQAKAPHVLAAYGFTDRNSYGNYIMWHEELERMNDEA